MSDKGKDYIGIIIKPAFTGSYYYISMTILNLHLQTKNQGNTSRRNVLRVIFP